jgi:hypothetical protein
MGIMLGSSRKLLSLEKSVLFHGKELELQIHRKHGVDNAHLMLKTWSSGFPWKSNIRINFFKFLMPA